MARIDDRLARTVGAARIHRMGGIAQERDAAEGPARQRIAVDHGVFQDLLGALDHAADIEPVEFQPGEGRHHV
jgi:hypothetical protein